MRGGFERLGISGAGTFIMASFGVLKALSVSLVQFSGSLSIPPVATYRGRAMRPKLGV
jgi:hypothetical protein